MERVILEAYVRKEIGKKENKVLRKEGLVPCVIYKQGEKTQSLYVKNREFAESLHTSAGENVLIDLKINEDGGKPKTKTVIIKELQHHPLKTNVLHIDFHQISLHETLKVNVPIVTKGEAIGVKRDEGVLEHILWEVEVECLPTEIPERFEIDVSEFEIGTSKLVKDLTAPAGVKILTDPEQAVVAVAAPKAVEEEVPAEGEEAAEPEVITEKKPEEEGAEESAEEKPAKKEKPEEKASKEPAKDK